jgi:pimeloyl-ACP methyl ester carboxylesterase
VWWRPAGSVRGRRTRIIGPLRRVGLDRLVDALAAAVARVNPGMKWAVANASWTLGSTGLPGMLDAAVPYTLAGVAERIKQDVLILAGAGDQFTTLDQVEKYQRALVNAHTSSIFKTSGPPNSVKPTAFIRPDPS